MSSGKLAIQIGHDYNLLIFKIQEKPNFIEYENAPSGLFKNSTLISGPFERLTFAYRGLLGISDSIGTFSCIWREFYFSSDEDAVIFKLVIT